MKNELQHYEETRQVTFFQATQHLTFRLLEIRDQVELATYSVSVHSIQTQVEADAILELELGLSPRRKR
jgi:hypothetical protein